MSHVEPERGSQRSEDTGVSGKPWPEIVDDLRSAKKEMERIANALEHLVDVLQQLRGTIRNL
jgi:hypothetical protein